MEEILLNIGSVVLVSPNDEIADEWLIIGKRAVNPDTLKAWDYVSVLNAGFEWNVSYDKKFSVNFFYFNHSDIEKIIRQEDRSI